MTEAEPACFSQADVWVDTEEALMKSGDLLNAINIGAWSRDSLRDTNDQKMRNITISS